TTTTTLQIEKPAMAAYPAPFLDTLSLPLNCRQAHGDHKTNIRKGDVLNFIVHNFYNECVPASYPGPNYVSSDGIISRRYEPVPWAGPNPFVTEYHSDKAQREISIAWWDAFLKVKWMNDTTWTIGMCYENCVQGWASLLKLRGDYGRNLDLYNY
ncbi:hypothetical protein C8Q72DRAFT_780267, partial [Fomitopsis betulina]